MQNPLITKLTAWLHWGCERELSHMLQRKIFNVNVAALVAFLSMLLFAVLDALADNPALVRALWLQIPFYPLVLVVPWLNRQGRAEVARWMLLFSITAAVAANVWLVSGSWLDLHFYFLLFAVAAVLFFPLHQWARIAASFLANATLFVYCEYLGVEPVAELLMLDMDVAMMFRIAALVTSLLAVAYIAWLGEHVAARNEKELEDLSGLDMLTRLPNHRRLEQRIAETITTSKRTGQYGAVMYLDLDNFKQLNEEHGHAAGDLLLQDVAQRLAGCIRETDMVARLGGDEFVVVLAELGRDAGEARKRAAAVAEKIRDALAQPYRIVVLSGHGRFVDHRCTASIGVELFSGGLLKEEDILKRADAAMYQAKDSGRNAIFFHEEVRHAWANPDLSSAADVKSGS